MLGKRVFGKPLLIQHQMDQTPKLIGMRENNHSNSNEKIGHCPSLLIKLNEKLEKFENKTKIFYLVSLYTNKLYVSY